MSNSDMMKVAAEYDAAGRIMARGFADEMRKLSSPSSVGSLVGRPAAGKAPSISAKTTGAKAMPAMPKPPKAMPAMPKAPKPLTPATGPKPVPM